MRSMLLFLLLALIAPAAFAGDGALLGDHARVNNLRVGSNRFTGIRVESGAAVPGNAADDNAGTAISASGGSIARDDTVVRNDGLVQLFLNTNVRFSDRAIAGTETASLGRDTIGNACSGSRYP